MASASSGLRVGPAASDDRLGIVGSCSVYTDSPLGTRTPFDSGTWTPARERLIELTLSSALPPGERRNERRRGQ
jgi:hypothetical protein